MDCTVYFVWCDSFTRCLLISPMNNDWGLEPRQQLLMWAGGLCKSHVCVDQNGEAHQHTIGYWPHIQGVVKWECATGNRPPARSTYNSEGKQLKLKNKNVRNRRCYNCGQMGSTNATKIAHNYGAKAQATPPALPALIPIAPYPSGKELLRWIFFHFFCSF